MKSPDRRAREVIVRYALLQLPGIVLTGAALVLLRQWLGLPTWLCVSVFALWIAKDALLFPLLWRSYLPEAGGPSEAMVGLTGEAVERIDGAGRVLVRGEVWTARLPEGAPPVGRGEPVKVRSVRGLTLLVEPAPAEVPPPGR